MSQVAEHPQPVEVPAELQAEEKVRGGAHWLTVWVVVGSVAAMLAALLTAGAGGTRGFFLPAVAVVMCGVAAFWDGSTGRIPNWLTYGGILVGLGCNSVVPLLAQMGLGTAVVWLGAVGPSASWAGFGACLVLVLVAPLLAGVHGGDLKLLAALGAMLGLVQTANALVPALAIAIVYSVINLVVAGRLNKVLQMGCVRVMELMHLGRARMEMEDAAPLGATHIPMAVPLALGFVVGQVWQWKVGG